MSIRTIIKTSNLAQLLLLLLLGLCLVAFGRGLHEGRRTLENYYELDSLLLDVENNTRQCYEEAHAFIFTGSAERYANWQILSQMRAGDAQDAATRGVSFEEAARRINLSSGLQAQVRSLLVQRKHLDTLLDTAVTMAMGNSGPPHWDRDSLDLRGAQAWADRVNLDGEVQQVLFSAQALREAQYRGFLDQIGIQERPLEQMVWAMAVALLALAASAVINVYIFQKRVVQPLGEVSRYAEGVAEGGDPAPVKIQHQDELASMFDALQRMKGTLFTRIRELKEAERRARKSKQQAVLARAQALTSLELAQKASHVQEDFLRRMSHEIRTPLNAIIGMSYLSLQAGPSGVQRDYISQINKAGSVLLDMVNRILDFSSANEGLLRRENRAFQLPRLFELLRQSVAASALEKQLELKFIIDPAAPAVVEGDERHLEEVLRILLDNAVKYTRNGVVECSVQYAHDDGPDDTCRLLFVVADSGPGMDAALKEKLFEPFALGDESLTRSNSGLGLGLALARQLVDLLGGELCVASSLGKGSRFFFEISVVRVQPVCSLETSPAQEAQEAVESIFMPADMQQHTVLVVEDNDINAQIASELLSQAGLAVRMASNGMAAVDEVRAGGVDLVIMDVQMPVMDGLEATRRIRDLGYSPESLPILAMTAHADAASRMDGKNVGMNDYLTKPVDPAALYAALERWLPGGLEHNPLVQNAEPEQALESENGTREFDMMRASEAAVAEPECPAVNVEAGLATVGGNHDLYRELLLRFVDHYGDSARELRGLLACGDLRGAARLAHTVKGVAANLGVERVCRLTRRMESTLPMTLPSESLMDEFEESMNEVLLRVRCLEGMGSMATAGTMHLDEEHREALLALLAELPELMETDWGNAESSLERFIPFVDGTPYAEDLSAILASVKDFDNGALQGQSAALQHRLRGENA
ncbi:MAG: response regulator [Desulfovibrio sp.]|uniref:response regulator n=1 Tax=Desulfovibrio sp. TaxID=885 RepID=UPI00135F0CA3|nr:response regulator [Desulfovibrio sp.]MTJ92014.1 response regulator [Desulfovibrio sp.]